MGELQSKSFEHPDQVISMPNLEGQVITLGESFIGRYVHQPGWRWSKDVKPLVGTESCQFHHQGVVVSGQMEVTTDEGAQKVLGPGTVFDIPPGHDAWVVGDEPCVSIEFKGVRGWAAAAADGERVLATLLMTDIVSSTETARKMGDAAWKELLAQHSERVRVELDNYRGYEVNTTGDGFLTMFDGTARAVRCAHTICKIAQEDGLEVRAGIHSGEIERQPDNIRGIAVHIVARIASIAGANRVVLSSSSVDLLEGSDLEFEDIGEHEMKGIKGKRRLFELLAPVS